MCIKRINFRRNAVTAPGIVKKNLSAITVLYLIFGLAAEDRQAGRPHFSIYIHPICSSHRVDNMGSAVGIPKARYFSFIMFAPSVYFNICYVTWIRVSLKFLDTKSNDRVV